MQSPSLFTYLIVYNAWRAMPVCALAHMSRLTAHIPCACVCTEVLSLVPQGCERKVDLQLLIAATTAVRLSELASNDAAQGAAPVLLRGTSTGHGGEAFECPQRLLFLCVCVCVGVCAMTRI